MDLLKYKALKEERAKAAAMATKRLRAFCKNCRKSIKACYCAHIKPFSTGAKFVVLIHPKEHRKRVRVGTGRLTHLCIKNSELIEGIDFTNNEAVNRIIKDDSNWPMVLYPGPQAIDVSHEGAQKLEQAVPIGKNLVIFVIDGSWFCAKKMLRVSHNLQKLPQIKFSPPHESIYQFRRQPKAICFSSIESVHFMIDQLQESQRWRSDSGYDNLLAVFKVIIRQQLAHLC